MQTLDLFDEIHLPVRVSEIWIDGFYNRQGSGCVLSLRNAYQHIGFLDLLGGLKLDLENRENTAGVFACLLNFVRCRLNLTKELLNGATPRSTSFAFSRNVIDWIHWRIQAEWK